MTLPTFDEFKSKALAAGSDEVLERRWAPTVTLETHSHPFGVDALVVQGEMWLTVAGVCRHLERGHTFTLNSEQAHAERYGPDGATYWVARRNSN
jgi:hypothetical protein